MPIDYTIGRIEAPPQDQGFLSGLTKGVNLRNNMAISQTNVLKQQEYADEIKRGRELRNLISGAYQDKPDLNQGELGRMIMPFNYQEGYKLQLEQIKKDAFLKQLPPGVVKYHRGDQELTKDDVLAIKTQGPATTSFMKSVDQILDVIDKGGINVANPTGKQYAQLEALITDLGAQYRILKHLGVPNANDQALTESFIGEPTRLKSQFKQVKTKLETAKKLIYDGFNAEMDIRGFDPIPEPELTGGQSSSAAPAVKGEVVVKPNGDLVYDGFVLQKVVK